MNLSGSFLFFLCLRLVLARASEGSCDIPCADPCLVNSRLLGLGSVTAPRTHCLTRAACALGCHAERGLEHRRLDYLNHQAGGSCRWRARSVFDPDVAAVPPDVWAQVSSTPHPPLEKALSQAHVSHTSMGTAYVVWERFSDAPAESRLPFHAPLKDIEMHYGVGNRLVRVPGFVWMRISPFLESAANSTSTSSTLPRCPTSFFGLSASDRSVERSSSLSPSSFFALVVDAVHADGASHHCQWPV